MLVTLITPTPEDVSAFGVRALSAYLKRAGYDVRLILLPGSHRKSSPTGDFIYRYSDDILEQITELCKDSQLIGVSFMSYFFDRAVQITQAIKKRLDVPVIWGGIHPTVQSEEALAYADMVCRGEGEGALLEIIQKIEKGEDYSDTENVWISKNGNIIRNPLRPLICDLDSLPFIDYDLDEHYCYDHRKDCIRKMDESFLKAIFPLRPGLKGGLQTCYRTMTDRGCPHKCSYCSISKQKELYEGQGFFRKRSVENVIQELQIIKERFPFVETIQFFDDTFFSRSTPDLEKFGKLFKEKIGMPFHAQGSPATITEKKMECLVDSGLIYTEMGIQTGSENTRKLYNRKDSNAEIVESAKIIHKFRDRLLVPDYHVIIENPWESDEDVIDTLNLILELPKPFSLRLATLQFFPGTVLYSKGKEEGLLEDDERDIYRQPFLAPQKTYTNFLIYLTTFQWIPKKVFRFLSSPRLVGKFENRSFGAIFTCGYIVMEKLRLLTKGIKALTTGDFKRILMYFRRME